MRQRASWAIHRLTAAVVVRARAVCQRGACPVKAPAPVAAVQALVTAGQAALQDRAAEPRAAGSQAPGRAVVNRAGPQAQQTLAAAELNRWLARLQTRQRQVAPLRPQETRAAAAVASHRRQAHRAHGAYFRSSL